MYRQPKRWLLLYAFLLLSAVSTTTFGSNKTSNSNPLNRTQQNINCNLTMVWGLWPPYQYFAPNGDVAGLQIDLVKQIASRAGCSLDFVQQSFQQNVESIRDGKADIMADITITEQRARFARFSIPYRHENLVLYVNNRYLDQCKNADLADLIHGDFRLGLTKGNWYGHTVARIQNDKALAKNIRVLAINDRGAEALFDNQIDGFFEDPIVMAYKLRQKNLQRKFSSCQIVVSGGPVSLMFSKKTVSNQTVQRINEAISAIKNTDAYKKRWSWGID